MAEFPTLLLALDATQGQQLQGRTARGVKRPLRCELVVSPATTEDTRPEQVERRACERQPERGCVCVTGSVRSKRAEAHHQLPGA